MAATLKTVDPATRAEVLAPDDVSVDSDGIVGRFVTRRRLTSTGYDLDSEWESRINGWNTYEFQRQGRR